MFIIGAICHEKGGSAVLALEYRRIETKEGHEAGRALLQEMTEKETGEPMPPVLTTDRGKPYFAQGGLFFSISHTKRHVFCALSEKEIGIDAEETDREISLNLAQKILSPAELAQYEQADEKRLALLTFWVLKEAQAKCGGTGLRGYPNHTNFSLDDPRVTEIDGCLVAVIEKEKDDAL